MSNLVPTIIRLPREDLKKYKAIAADEGVSFSELVRDSLAIVGPPVKRSKKRLSFFDIGKIAVKGGPKDGARNHDYYLNKLVEEQRG